jgi:hypothetical protein
MEGLERKVKKYKIIVLGLVVGSLVLTGCNTNQASSQVKATYVNSFNYDSKTCKELKNELNIVENRAADMASNIDTIKDSQDTKLAYGWLFWPSYLIIDDNKAEAKELSKVKGVYKAIKNTLKSKNCD